VLPVRESAEQLFTPPPYGAKRRWERKRQNKKEEVNKRERLETKKKGAGTIVCVLQANDGRKQVQRAPVLKRGGFGMAAFVGVKERWGGGNKGDVEYQEPAN